MQKFSLGVDYTMSNLVEEISRRRTFAIISHPDAGKTTLTEKFLLYGGAIAQAGVVKGKKNSRAATSDWMEIEKQRGISVTSSVMQFQYGGFCITCAVLRMRMVSLAGISPLYSARTSLFNSVTYPFVPFCFFLAIRDWELAHK